MRMIILILCVNIKEPRLASFKIITNIIGLFLMSIEHAVRLNGLCLGLFLFFYTIIVTI